MELWITINPDETPFPQTLNELKVAIEKDFPYQLGLSFALCREVASREHYHLYVKADALYSDQTRNGVRRYLVNLFQGEIRISKRQVENAVRAIAYTIKDGNYVTHNVDWMTFLNAKAITHPKTKPYQELLLGFYKTVGDKGEKTLINEVIDIFDRCNIPIDLQRIAKVVRLSRIKQKDSSYRKELVEKIYIEL